MRRTIALTWMISAAAMLTACGGAESANNAADEIATNVPEAEASAANEAATVVPAAAAAGGAPTADFMVGKWSAISEDCSDTLEFRKDGSLTTPIGDAKWTLVGDKMTMDYGDGSKQPASTLKVVSQDRIEITTGSGRKEISIRC